MQKILAIIISSILGITTAQADVECVSPDILKNNLFQPNDIKKIDANYYAAIKTDHYNTSYEWKLSILGIKTKKPEKALEKANTYLKSLTLGTATIQSIKKIPHQISCPYTYKSTNPNEEQEGVSTLVISAITTLDKNK